MAIKQFGSFLKLNRRYFSVLNKKKSADSKVPSKKGLFATQDTKHFGEPRYCLAITNWVLNPDLGIFEFQSLMKASAFIVKGNIINPNDNQYHVVTSNHNVAPWLYPQYYPEEFMKQINEKHTFCTLELRAHNGDLYTQFDLLPYIFHHPDKDIAVLHLKEETQALDLFKGMEFKLLDTESYVPPEDHPLTFYGHEVFEDMSNAFDAIDDPSATISLSAPRVYNGTLIGRTKYQTFCKTDTPLPPGMCGGIAVSKRGSICGMIEGIVPANHPNVNLRNLGTIIEAQEILSFLKEVEHVKNNNLMSSDNCSVLFGGQALEELRNHTPDLNVYKDPMKVLHNTLFPQDKKIYGDEFAAPHGGRGRGPTAQGESDASQNFDLNTLKNKDSNKSKEE